MDWGFIWLMFILKVPIVALLVIVWWAVRQSPEESEQPGGGDGGIKRPPHPRRPFPRRPRRGPHGDPAPTAPPRTRSVLVKAKRVDA